MNQYVIEFILGLFSGAFLSITGILPTGLILFIIDFLKIGEYKSSLGAILFLNLFPITIGSVWEFYKAKKIDFNMSYILLFSMTVGSYFGSKLVVGYNYKLSTKTIKYITSVLGAFIGVAFFISAQNEKN